MRKPKVPMDPSAFVMHLERRKQQYHKLTTLSQCPTMFAYDDKKANVEKEAFDGSSVALLGLHEDVYKETSCGPPLTLIKRILTRK